MCAIYRTNTASDRKSKICTRRGRLGLCASEAERRRSAESVGTGEHPTLLRCVFISISPLSSFTSPTCRERAHGKMANDSEKKSEVRPGNENTRSFRRSFPPSQLSLGQQSSHLGHQAASIDPPERLVSLHPLNFDGKIC